MTFSNGVPTANDWQTIPCFQATGMPSAARPPEIVVPGPRPVVAAADIVLAGPDNFHRAFTSLGDLHRLADEVAVDHGPRPKPPPSSVVWIFTCSG